jgi:putative ABC transport system ATP-binding protein
MSEWSGQVAVQVSAVERAFGDGERRVQVLKGVDLTVGKGQLIALYGPSGSGKTTLLNLIGALDHPTAGEIIVNDQTITRLGDRRRAKLRRQHFGFIFQNYTLMPTYSAGENIDLGLRLAGYGYFERRKRVKQTLGMMQLSAWHDHLPDQLSGGQRQRVAIARALASDPKVILADEPTSGLDSQTSRHILELFRKIAHEKGTTFLIVSHDPLVVNYVDQAYDLEGGRVHARVSEVTAEIIEEEISDETN